MTKAELKTLIKEEVVKQQKIQTLKEHKAFIEHCSNKLQEGHSLTDEEEQTLEEISWQGIKGAFGAGKQMAGAAAAQAGQAVANKAAQAGQAVAGKVAQAGQAVAGAANQAGQAIAGAANQAVDAVKTKYASVEQGFSEVAKKLGDAATAGDIQSLKADIQKIVQKQQGLIQMLNQKEQKLGLPASKF